MLFNKVVTISLIALSSSLALSAITDNLSPKALACYRQAMTSDYIFKMNKKFKLPSEVEKVAVQMCTYSDAEGSLRCYEQADKMDDVLPLSKRYVNTIRLEQKFALLCSNSGAHLYNAQTGDADAIECVKAVKADPTVLVGVKEHMEFSELEDFTTQFCISSNAKGAVTCYKNSLDKANKILESSDGYKGADALDKIIMKLCRGSRLR
jgi:hypothetical protein